MPRRAKRRGPHPIAAPFTVAAPSGVRIRDRLRLTPADAQVLTLAGEHLGRHQRADLAGRIRIGNIPARENRRAERKKKLTALSSSRWTGAMTRASDDQYQLSVRCLYQERASLRRAIGTIGKRLAVPCGQRHGRVRGYASQDERFCKQRRLQVLTGRLARVERRIETGRPAIVIGGRRLLKARHNLGTAQLTEAQWRQRWQAGRLFLTADGETGAPHGNYTITVDPGTGEVSVVLPEPLRYLANAPRGRYKLACTAGFHHRRQEWLDRVTANRAVRYDLVYDPVRDRWYLDASWSAGQAALPSPGELARSGARLLAVDLNAGHLAACVVDVHGNPVGQPVTVPLELTGPASTRDGRLRDAITWLLDIAREHGCAGLAIENLGFTDARATGRETMGRGRRGKRFRHTVAGIPTARFRERLRGMAWHAGMVVVAVDPAYTSIWGGQYWQAPLRQQARHQRVTRHHGASVAIGRRALGHGIRRRPGVTAPGQRTGTRRATGQTVTVPEARGTASPPRTTGTPNRGGKTCWSRSDQPALLPGPQDRSEGHRLSPVYGDPANTGQLA